MRIIHVEDFFHPEAGYQINVLSKYQALQNNEVFIITSEIERIPKSLTDFFGKDNIKEKDKIFEETNGVKIVRLPIHRYISGRSIYKYGIKNFINNLKPDILYIHGEASFVGMQYILRSKSLSYPIVFDSHMLEMASKNKFSKLFQFFYRTFFTPIIKKMCLKVIRTQDDNYVEKCLGIPLSQAPFISHGTDTKLFKPDEEVKKTFREKYRLLDDDFVVIYTGKLDEAKGGKFLAEAFKTKFLNKNNKNIVLLVIGNTSGEYGEEIEKLFSQSQNRILRFPTQKYIDLPKYYQAADLSVFPKQCSLSFYDAQACGLPVISEDNNINVDRLQHNNGLNFKSGDIPDFRNAIIKLLEMDNVEYEQIVDNAQNYVKRNFSYENIADNYFDILINELKTFKKNNKLV
jgi:glycosyltransferase involved in cell wall biosynthesis